MHLALVVVSFTTRIPHLEGQEVFGSTERRANIAPKSKGDSQKYDCENVSQLRVNAKSRGFANLNVDAS